MDKMRIFVYILLTFCIYDYSHNGNFVMTAEIEKIQNNVAKSRKKRSLFNLSKVMECTKKCAPLTYEGYGCYCGISGDGMPQDGLDRCCQTHDKCYDAIEPYCGGTLGTYSLPYSWKCSNNTPTCMKPSIIQPFPWCTSKVCKCDREFALCLSQFPCPHDIDLECSASGDPVRKVQNVFHNIYTKLKNIQDKIAKKLNTTNYSA